MSETSFVADVYCTVVSVYRLCSPHSHGIEQRSSAYFHERVSCDHRSPGTPILDSRIGVSKFYDSQLSTKLLLIDGSHIASLVFSPRHSGSKYPIFGQYGMSSTPRNCTGIDIQSPAVYACPPE